MKGTIKTLNSGYHLLSVLGNLLSILKDCKTYTEAYSAVYSAYSWFTLSSRQIAYLSCQNYCHEAFLHHVQTIFQATKQPDYRV